MLSESDGMFGDFSDSAVCSLMLNPEVVGKLNDLLAYRAPSSMGQCRMILGCKLRSNGEKTIEGKSGKTIMTQSHARQSKESDASGVESRACCSQAQTWKVGWKA